MNEDKRKHRWRGMARFQAGWTVAVLLVSPPMLPAEGLVEHQPVGLDGGEERVQIVTHADVKTSHLSAREVANIFLGRKRHWDDGSRIKLAVLKRDRMQDSFFRAIVGRSSSQYWTYWRDMVFSGSGRMPKRFASSDALLAYVATEPGTVGFITDTSMTQGTVVNIITVRETRNK